MNVLKYARLYKGFDTAHSLSHMRKVIVTATDLAKDLIPEKIYLVRLAAMLHDVGLVGGREDHEIRGAKMIANDPQFKELGEDREILVEAIAQHRASTGSPKSVVGQIISDADRICTGSVEAALYRSYTYAVSHGKRPGMTSVRHARQHISHKYGPGGTGRRCYFVKTEKALSRIFDPVLTMTDEDVMVIIKKQEAIGGR